MLYTLAVHFFFFRYGCTKILISDQGREFVNKVNESLFQRFKTEHRVSTAYHPQTNELVEWYNQTLQRSLVKLVNKEQDNWDEYIDGVLFAYRTAKQKSTQFTPFELMYCRYVHITISGHVAACTIHAFLSAAFICYHRKPILPIERELVYDVETDVEDEGDNVQKYCEDMIKLKNDLFSKADQNIKEAQTRQKRDYDKKHHHKKVCHITIVCMLCLKHA